MKTQTADVTYADGTVEVAGQARLTVHTGCVRVAVTRRLLRTDITFKACGPLYTTATVELKDGRMEAITDNRVTASPFSYGWR